MGITVIGIITFLLYSPSDSGSNVKNQNSETVSQAETTAENEKDFDLDSPYADTVQTTSQILGALSWFYLASEKDIVNADPSLMGINANLMEQNRYFKLGIDQLNTLIESPNKVVELATKGMTLGAMQLSITNQNLIDFLRNTDQSDPKLEQEFSYRLAEYGSKQKEGYATMYTTGPQIIVLFWKSAESDNPTGPIPYKISKAERQQLLSEIDESFGEYFKKDDINYKKTQTHNAVLLIVKQIRDNLKYDTYEEEAMANPK